MTCSNDGSLRLWDRQTYKQVLLYIIRYDVTTPLSYMNLLMMVSYQ